MTKKLNILLLGSGGRECALAWKLAQSPALNHLYIAPGNAGTAQYGTNVALKPLDFDQVADFCLNNGIDMLIVGSEDPLVAGIADYMAQRLPELQVIGPSKAGAQLEGSKDFAKQFMMKHDIPTAAHLSVTAQNLDEGLRFLEQQQAPYVLKADGLAAGKGVLIINDLDEAKAELRAMLEGKFGNASATVVIEQFLKGIECSVFVVTDGKNYQLLPVAKDYKRIGENDCGLNTGGMGAVSPVSFADEAFMDKVRTRIIERTLAGLQQDGIPYCGFIFFGLMNVDGDPYVIEYNCRMGDPETEVVMPRLKTDLVMLLCAAASGSFQGAQVEIDPRYAVTVMLVSGGYPQSYEKNKVITGLDAATGSILFHAGTKRDDQGQVLTSGGRVLAVTSMGTTKDEALAHSFESISHIAFDKMYYRRDIGFDLK
jgi:phosphoribosylamine--glycine ligase